VKNVYRIILTCILLLIPILVITGIGFGIMNFLNITPDPESWVPVGIGYFCLGGFMTFIIVVIFGSIYGGAKAIKLSVHEAYKRAGKIINKNDPKISSLLKIFF
jgi:hypothetical protein